MGGPRPTAAARPPAPAAPPAAHDAGRADPPGGRPAAPAPAPAELRQAHQARSQALPVSAYICQPRATINIWPETVDAARDSQERRSRPASAGPRDLQRRRPPALNPARSLQILSPSSAAATAQALITTILNGHQPGMCCARRCARGATMISSASRMVDGRCATASTVARPRRAASERRTWASVSLSMCEVASSSSGMRGVPARAGPAPPAASARPTAALPSPSGVS